MNYPGKIVPELHRRRRLYSRLLRQGREWTQLTSFVTRQMGGVLTLGWASGKVLRTLAGRMVCVIGRPGWLIGTHWNQASPFQECRCSVSSDNYLSQGSLPGPGERYSQAFQSGRPSGGNLSAFQRNKDKLAITSFLKQMLYEKDGSVLASGGELSGALPSAGNTRVSW